MPFLIGFSKRKAFKYGTVFPGSNQSGFPKLFRITGDSDIAAELASGGGIAVTLADGTTEIPFGLYPSTDLASGDVLLRTKIDPLTSASTGDVMAYLYYDASGTTSEDKAGTVANGYVLFMPLEEDPSGSSPQMFDWVSESNVGTSAGSMTSGDLVAGQVGNGMDLDGSDDCINLGTGGGLAADFTLEIAIRGTAFFSSATHAAFIGKWGSSSPNYILWCFNNGNSLRLGGSDSNEVVWIDGIDAIDDGAWHVVVGRRAGTSGSILVDGIVGATGTISVPTPTSEPLLIGAYNTGATGFLAAIADEVRISSVARSADWLAYAYQDDFNNADTFTLGDEEVDGGGGGTYSPWWRYQRSQLIGGGSI